MKKDLNYDQTEKWLSEQFSATEKHIKYKGRALDKIDNKTGRDSFFQYSAVRIAGAFLVLVLIGGGLFGALKFLEYKGTQINSSHSGNGKINYVQGETDINCRYIVINSGQKRYFPAVYLSTAERTLPDGKTNITSYSYAESNFITVPYSPDFSIDNNVADREMEVKRVEINDPADERADCIPLYTDLNGLYEHLKDTDSGLIMVSIAVTWDTEDEINTYCVTFNVYKESDTADSKDGSELISDINGIKTYDYGKKLEKLQKAKYDGDPDDFVRVLTGGGLYTVPVSRAYDMERLSRVKHYDLDSDPKVMEFGGDLEIYNNVSDKQMEITSVTLIYPDGNTSSGTLTGAFRSIYAGTAGTYIIKAYVTWDKDPEAAAADKYTVYCVYFALHKSESHESGNNKEWYEEEKKDTKYRYLAVSVDNKFYYPPVVCTKHVRCVSDASTVQKMIGSDLSRYKEIRIPYSGGTLELLNNVYDKEKMTVVSMTVKDNSDAPAKALDTAEELNTYLKSADAGTYRVSLELSWDTYPVINKGDGAYVYAAVFYVDKSADVTDTSPDETTAEETAEPPEQIQEFDPEGKLCIYWKLINNTICKIYNPPVLRKRVCKDGTVIKELSYESDPCDVEYRYTDTLAADNKAYPKRAWRVCSVTVNKEKEFGSFETAFEYIHDLAEKTSGTAYVEATVTWDAGALINKDADRTEYTYVFNVLYTCPDDIDPRSDPYVTEIMKGWLSVVIGEARYHPGITKKLTYNGDQVTEFEYYHDDVVLEWAPGEKIAVSNEIYTMWHIYGVTVNGEKYDKAEEAFASLPTDRVSRVEVEVSWSVTDPSFFSDAAELKTTYIFEFYVKPVS